MNERRNFSEKNNFSKNIRKTCNRITFSKWFWCVEDGTLKVDLNKVPEASKNACRIEGESLPFKVMLASLNGEYYAYENKCAHMGRCIDPDPEAGNFECCSVMGSKYALDGKVLGGPAKDGLHMLEVSVQDNIVSITL